MVKKKNKSPKKNVCFDAANKNFASFTQKLEIFALKSTSILPSKPVLSSLIPILPPSTSIFTPVEIYPPNLFDNSFSSSKTSLKCSSFESENFKTALCHEFRNTQTCRYGEKCKFAHGDVELRLPIQANPHYKTMLCAHFTNYGDCPFGSKCKFVHRRDRSKSFDFSSSSTTTTEFISSHSSQTGFSLFQSSNYSNNVEIFLKQDETNIVQIQQNAENATNVQHP